MSERYSLALLEVHGLAAVIVVADRCAKAAGVRLMGIENPESAAQCLKLAGTTGAVTEAAEVGKAVAEMMGSEVTVLVMAAPDKMTRELAEPAPVYSPSLDAYDDRIEKENSMNNSDALGLIETQGLVASLHATDEMLKASNVTVVGKEKIGGAYVTIIVRGDVAAVQTAIETGKRTVEQLGGKLILADVITRPHPDLVALLPA